MTDSTNLAGHGRTLMVRVPLALRKRGGRKLVVMPEGAAAWALSRRPQVDNAMVKALARAFRWREMLDNGEYATIREIAAAVKINESYVGRVLRLTLLTPRTVEAILDGRQPTTMTLAALMRPLPVEWNEQHQQLGYGPGDWC